MTTAKPVVDSLTTQGKGMPENDVPPQTIIRPELAGTYGKLGPRSDMYEQPIIRPEISPFNVGGIVPDSVSVGGIVPDSVRVGLASLPLPGEHIIPIKVDGGAEGIIRADVPIKTTPAFDEFVAAESRRQVVQAESMVNLAIGVVAAKMTTHHIGFACDENGRPTTFRISITPQELSEFCWNYTVKQQIGEDGGFIISVTPKE